MGKKIGLKNLGAWPNFFLKKMGQNVFWENLEKLMKNEKKIVENSVM